jgi:hypothetical protein
VTQEPGAKRREGKPSSPNWRWCLKIGVAVMLVDLVALTLGQGQDPTSGPVVFLESLDQIANVLLFGYAGYRTGQDTGRATAAAEAGVIASVLPALAAALYQIFQPSLTGGPAAEAIPLPNRVVASVAFNIVLGGVSAWFCGWLASRGRRTTQ